MKTYSKFTISLFALIVIAFMSLSLTKEANASHFRYGHLTYTRGSVDCDSVNFFLYCAFRNGYGINAVGQIFTETIGATSLFFGDGGQTTTLRFKVLQFTGTNSTTDWVYGVALMPGNDAQEYISHYYSTGGPSYLAEINSAARTGLEVNHPNAGYRVSALLWRGDCNNSPVSSLPVILNLPIQSSVTFNVPAIGSSPDKYIRYRYATVAEMGVTGSNPWPAFGGAGSINAVTGDITWNTSSATLGQLFSTQVVIEEFDLGTDTLKSRVAVDWLTQMLPPCPRPAVPVITISNATLNGVPIQIACGQTIVANVGSCLQFDATATDGDVGDPVTLNAPVPPGGTWTPALPTTGTTTVTSQFSWCFASPFTGVMTITATDSCGNQGLCAVGLQWQAISPVELASFTSNVNGNDVVLNWSTAREENNARFEIERANVISGNVGEYNIVGTVAGNGNSSVVKTYTFSDRGLNAGNYSYRLKQVDFNGNFQYHNLNGEVIVGVPTKFDLLQNYPNPFNPTTNIAYVLPLDGNVSLSIYDNSGKLVSSINEGYKSAGYYTVAFSASNLSSGIYYYKIDFSGSEKSFVKVMKMVVLK